MPGFQGAAGPEFSSTEQTPRRKGAKVRSRSGPPRIMASWRLSVRSGPERIVWRNAQRKDMYVASEIWTSFGRITRSRAESNPGLEKFVQSQTSPRITSHPRVCPERGAGLTSANANSPCKPSLLLSSRVAGVGSGGSSAPPSRSEPPTDVLRVYIALLPAIHPQNPNSWRLRIPGPPAPPKPSAQDVITFRPTPV